MTTQFSALGITLTLERYPATQESNLQAWDASDEHIIKHLQENHQSPCNTLIINDNFGALTTCIQTSSQTPWSLWHLTDTKTSRLGAIQNLATNGLINRAAITDPSIENEAREPQWLTSLDPLPQDLSLVLIKLPKNLSYFSYLLRQLSQVLPQGTQILIGARAKGINKALLANIERDLGPASASLTWKKTRIITCVSDGKARTIGEDVKWSVPEYQLQVTNKANVFAANKLDIGARIMLENMPKGEFKQVIDLGCGNGILGLRATRLYPNAEIHFVDDSYMAVTSASDNWQLNQCAPEKGYFHWDDCLTHLPAEVEADLVLCNPPFHQGEAITDHIAWQMFVDARRRLKPGGLLHVVGNRHLAYHVKLKRLFKNCTTIASNGKFVILQAKK